MKTALVLGAGGFIGSHLVKRLKKEGFWVRGVDLKYPEFSKTEANDFVIGDLTNPSICSNVFFSPIQTSCDQPGFDEVYQLAADMGGAGYIFTGNHDADIMHNSALINLNCCYQSVEKNIQKIFYSSSACMYPAYNQEDPDNPNCKESSAYPAAPDSEYGWEKLFSERLYLSYHRNYKLNARIARFHNIFGPEGTWKGGKEKAPAAMCRKVLESNGEMEVWGDGQQTRSFLYIDDCIEQTLMLMNSDFMGPVNIGSEEMIKINDLAKMAIEISGKDTKIKNISGPLGVRGRNSDNQLFHEKVGFYKPKTLRQGMEITYKWIESQIKS